MTMSLLADPFAYPGDDPATVRQAAADIGHGRERLGAMIDGLDGSLSTLAQSWAGTDAEAARREVTALTSAARRLADRADDVVRAVNRHGDDLDRIRRSIDGLRAEWASAGSPWVLPDPLASWGVSPPDLDPLSAGISGLSTSASTSGTQVWEGLRARWQELVHEQEESARTCRSALEQAGGGDWQYAPGAGAARGDLGSALGLPELTFDDRPGADPARAWSALSAEERALFTAVGADRLPVLLSGNPGAAAQAWRKLAPMARQALIQTRPKDIGGVDGLPIVARDQANRLLLPEQRALVQAELDGLLARGPGIRAAADNEFPAPPPTDPDPVWSAQVAQGQARLAVLDDIAGSVSAGVDAAGLPRHTYLMALDVTGSGRVAIAYGNPDTADQVVSLVPGTGSSLAGVLGDAERTKSMMGAAEQSGGGTVAGVVWTDWTPPPTIPNAALESYADNAVDGLSSYAEGLRASHEGDQPFRSVIAAHSYGTVLTAKAASGDHTLNADALVLLGSPGTDLANVRDVRLTGVSADDVAQHVFATTSDADPVGDAPEIALTLNSHLRLGGPDAPDLGPVDGPALGFSGDPTHPDWGANVFHTPADHSLWYYRASEHGRYWDPDSSQLETMGDIIAGRYHGDRW